MLVPGTKNMETHRMWGQRKFVLFNYLCRGFKNLSIRIFRIVAIRPRPVTSNGSVCGLSLVIPNSKFKPGLLHLLIYGQTRHGKVTLTDKARKERERKILEDELRHCLSRHNIFF